ncbi:MAG: right-handed parallel beta-helix repeat-containing protein [Chryseosolibacter sp.]
MKTVTIHFVFIFLTFSVLAQVPANESKEGPETFFGRIWIVKPGQDYTKVLDKLQPGDELVLHEGVYEGSAILRNSGTKEKPITVRGFGKGERRPVLLWEGTGAILFQVNGSHVVFDYLEFRSKYTYALRMGGSGKGNSNVIIRNNIFYECGGGCISANASVDYDAIDISNNYFIGPKKTPVYIGQHQGKANVKNFSFTGNVVDGSQVYGGSITGYGIELKLNVTNSVVENNFITNTKGPGIMVYGAEKPDAENANVVRNNIVIASRNDAGIVVGGGPSVVTDNLLMGCAGGIEVMNYGGRNLLQNIVLRNNTAVCNRNYGISFGNNQEIKAQNNLVIHADTASAYIRDPEKGINNTTQTSSAPMEAIVHDKLVNCIPLKRNLSKIWLRISSGPLSQSDVQGVIDLILEYKRPVQILNDEEEELE